MKSVEEASRIETELTRSQAAAGIIPRLRTYYERSADRYFRWTRVGSYWRMTDSKTGGMFGSRWDTVIFNSYGYRARRNTGLVLDAPWPSKAEYLRYTRDSLMETRMTPFKLSLLFYRKAITSPTNVPAPPIGLSPSFRSDINGALRELAREGLIELNSSTLAYTLTAKAHVFVDHVMKLPMPEQLPPRWTMPSSEDEVPRKSA